MKMQENPFNGHNINSSSYILILSIINATITDGMSPLIAAMDWTTPSRLKYSNIQYSNAIAPRKVYRGCAVVQRYTQHTLCRDTDTLIHRNGSKLFCKITTKFIAVAVAAGISDASRRSTLVWNYFIAHPLVFDHVKCE